MYRSGIFSNRHRPFTIASGSPVRVVILPGGGGEWNGTRLDKNEVDMLKYGSFSSLFPFFL